MTDSRVDTIVDGMNKTHRGESFQYETDLLLSLQKSSPATFAADRDEINNRVAMDKLGFPEDFKIVSVTNDNRILSTSQDGSKYQLRNGSTLDVVQEFPAGAVPPVAGLPTGEFVPRADGSAQYTVKAGDTLWNITKDILTRNGAGRVPSNTDIDQTYRKIAQANALTNPNRLSIGQQLNIPAPGAEGIYPVVPPLAVPPVPGYPNTDVLTSGHPNLKPVGVGIFNPMAAAGLPGGDDSYVYSRTKTGVENIAGNQRIGYTGWIRDSSLGLNTNNTKFDASEVTDASGRILSRHIDYSNPMPQYADWGAKLKFDRGFGSPIELGVRSVDTTFDITGNYQSTIRTDDGRTFHSITNSQGKVIRFYQA